MLNMHRKYERIMYNGKKFQIFNSSTLLINQNVRIIVCRLGKLFDSISWCLSKVLRSDRQEMRHHQSKNFCNKMNKCIYTVSCHCTANNPLYYSILKNILSHCHVYNTIVTSYQ